MEKDQAGIRNRIAVLYGSCTYAYITAFEYLNQVYATRSLFYRERSVGMYSTLSFASSMIITDAPILLFGALCFIVPFYFLAGLSYNAGAFFFFMLAYFGMTVVFVAFSETLAIWCAKIELAGFIFGAIFAFYFAMAGFIITRHDIPPWLIWGYWISFMRYLLEALVINEVDGHTYFCKPYEYIIIDVPLINGSTAPKLYCPLTTGNQIINSFGMYKELLWPDIIILYGVYVLLIIIAALGLKFAKHQKR